MTKIRFFTDEDIYGAVAGELRAAGFDAVSTPEAARLEETDESQLLWAAQERRALVSFNVSDFAALHTAWIQNGQSHHGVIVSKQIPLGELVRRLIRLSQSLTANDMMERLEYLSSWK